jgi:tellurite resistance protein TehA-like permease
MKRLILGSLSVLLLATTASVVKAETTVPNPTADSPTVRTHLTPFGLVSLASQGYLKQQGIPSSANLTRAYHLRQITAKDLVQAAVKANRLSPETLNDESYINAVAAELKAGQEFY